MEIDAIFDSDDDEDGGPMATSYLVVGPIVTSEEVSVLGQMYKHPSFHDAALIVFEEGEEAGEEVFSNPEQFGALAALLGREPNMDECLAWILVCRKTVVKDHEPQMAAAREASEMAVAQEEAERRARLRAAGKGTIKRGG